MSSPRTAPRWLAATLRVAALLSSACIDEVVVGTQQSPIGSLDAGRDASQPPDASSEPDVQPPEPDAAPPPEDASAEDSGPQLSDAAIDDGGPVVVLFGGDAGCDAADCGLDAGALLSPCSGCDPIGISLSPDARFDACAGGAPEVCWENPDNTCSRQCPATETCAGTSDCAPDEYCFYPDEECGHGSRGWCAPRPRGDCTAPGLPVCGCDGVIYPTGCHAVQLGIAVAGIDYQSCPLEAGVPVEF